MSGSKTLEERFETATVEVRNLKDTPDNNALLQLYGLYKRVTVGTCNTSKPWAIQVEATSKWEAWESVSSVSKEQAMTTYIMLVNKLFRDNKIYKNI